MVDSETAFHEQRRMFVVRDGRLELGPFNSPLSHRDWFLAEDWVGLFEGAVRGFFDETGIYFYRGATFASDPEVEETAVSLVPVFEELGLPAGLPVFAGMVRQETTGRWPPLKQVAVLASAY